MYAGKKIEKVYVAAACRTAIGRTAGSLSGISDTKLMSLAFQETMVRFGHESLTPDGVYVGCCFPQEQYNLARKAVLASKMGDCIPGATLNRTCCSSMEALIQGARQIMTGEAQMILVGGVENMSRSPHVMKNAIRNMRSKTEEGLPTFSKISGDLTDEMGICAEITARKYQIDRDEQDEAAYESHMRAKRAVEEGSFKQEIFPVKFENGRVFDWDEGVLEDIKRDDLANESPVILRDGTITKLNASPMNDGAAAMLLISEQCVKKYGIRPIAEYISSETVGVPSRDFIVSPTIAIEKLLYKNRLSLEDIDTIECNEAYSAQHLICGKILGWDISKVNILGGSVALGHPLGCTGLRICTTLVYLMNRKKSKYGIAAMCAGGGMGQSVLFGAVF